MLSIAVNATATHIATATATVAAAASASVAAVVVALSAYANGFSGTHHWLVAMMSCSSLMMFVGCVCQCRSMLWTDALREISCFPLRVSSENINIDLCYLFSAT